MGRARRAVAAVAAALALAGVASACSSDSSASPPIKISPTASGGLHATAFPTPRPRPTFTLTDTAGESYDFAQETDGRPTLLYFGYTNCPDICPLTMADLGEAMRSVPADLQKETRIVFVTTDPTRDTPPVIKAWLANFDHDLPVPFVGLTGSLQQVETAQRLAGVPVAEDNGQTHSTEVLVYGPDDQARVFYTAASMTAGDVSHDLPIVAKEPAASQG